ncbi:MAG: UvrD-helicase domain-containing protein, partial [Chloroflexi bacterium]|nr:UvrD-helicase domain-containing protein [Chloroflexota bacterium]
MTYSGGPETRWSKIDPLTIDRGSVTAPAGCGKTQLIADALTSHTDEKPVLILTHTNAGVAALRGRLRKVGVPPKRYSLSTIDGWAMRLIGTFPTRSAADPNILKLTRPSTDYQNIRQAAARILHEGHVNDILRASYAHLIVDEYQDCTESQHAIVSCAAETLPTCVLGDPMQAIFGFRDDTIPSWEEDVCKIFPAAGQLTKPWRWINADAEALGDWLLHVREKLCQGHSVDLCEAPAAVNWVQLDGLNDQQKQWQAALIRPPGGNGTVLIIGDKSNPKNHSTIARQTPGAITVEAVELKDLVEFASSFDLRADDALTRLVEFAKSVMTKVEAPQFLGRIKTLTRGTARKQASPAEQAALTFVRAPSESTAMNVL